MPASAYTWTPRSGSSPVDQGRADRACGRRDTPTRRARRRRRARSDRASSTTRSATAPAEMRPRVDWPRRSAGARRRRLQHVAERHAGLRQQLELANQRDAVERDGIAGVRSGQDRHAGADRARRLLERAGERLRHRVGHRAVAEHRRERRLGIQQRLQDRRHRQASHIGILAANAPRFHAQSSTTFVGVNVTFLAAIIAIVSSLRPRAVCSRPLAPASIASRASASVPTCTVVRIWRPSPRPSRRGTPRRAVAAAAVRRIRARAPA